MREWLGDRVVDNLSEAECTLVNKHFEKTIGVDRSLGSGPIDLTDAA